MTDAANVAAGRATIERLNASASSADVSVIGRSRLAPGVLASLVAVLVLGSCGGGGGGGGGGHQAKKDGGSKSAVAGARPTAGGETDVGKAGAQKIRIHGDWLSAGAGAVWLSGPSEVYRLDPQSGRTVATIPVPERPCGASDVGFGALWTATCDKPGLARIDPATNRVSRHVRLALPEELDDDASIGAGVGGVWLVVDGPACTACRLARLDPKSLTVAARIPVKSGSAGVRVGYGAVWVTNPDGNVVQKIDPRRKRVAHTTTAGDGPRYLLAVGQGGVFILNQFDGTITRLDPRTGEKTATIPADLAGQTGEMTTGGGWVWVRETARLLSRIDPRTNRVVERYGPPSGNGGLIVGFGAVWIAAHDVDTLWRLPLENA